MKITRRNSKIKASSIDKRLSFTSTQYKGYRISLDHKNNCYNIYDKHGELEDAGFTSQLAAKEAIDKLVKDSGVNASKKITAGSMPYVKWVKKAEDGSWVMWGGSNSPDIDPNFLDRINHPNYPNPEYNIENQYTDYTVLPAGQSPDDVNASKKITAYEDVEYLDNQETLSELIDELASSGVDIYDAQEILQALGADYGYDRDDQFAILEDIQEYVGQGINSAEEIDDELETTEQEFTSKDTSINSSKLPAIYKFVNFPKGSVVLDFGGGKFDNGVEYLQSLGCEGYVYDPYNRTSEHNAEVVKAIRSNGGADIVLNSNVLNVIKEAAARRTVLKNIKKLVKPNGKVYITVYEGTSKNRNKPGPTSKGYQLNQLTKDYLDEIREVFPDADLQKGNSKLIVATPNGSAVKSSRKILSSTASNKVNDLIFKAESVKDSGDLIDLLADVSSIDEKMYQHYCDLDQSGEYTPAAIGKMISNDLYRKLDSIRGCVSIKASAYNSIDYDKLDDIANRYNTSKPVSGDWNTETEHEMRAISSELGLSLSQAKQVMIEELGFSEEQFDNIPVNASQDLVTVGIYGDEVPGFEIVEQIVSYFKSKGIKVSDVSGDFDYGWEMNLTGEPRQLFLAVCNKIPGYNSNSVDEFINEYRIDDVISGCNSINASQDTLTSRIFDFLDDCGGYTDYNQKVEDVSEEFGMSPDEAEGYVSSWAQGMDAMWHDTADQYEDQYIEESTKIESSLAPFQARELVKELQDELYNKASEVMQRPEFGFTLEEIADYLVVEVEYQPEVRTQKRFEYHPPRIKCEVRAELSFDALMELADELNPIVEKYSEWAYFDAVTSGIIDAYIELDQIKASTSSTKQPVTAGYFDPPEPAEPDTVIVPIEFDNVITLEDYNIASFSEDELFDDAYTDEYDGLSLDDEQGVEEKIGDLVITQLPDEPGNYRISGIANLAYQVSNIFMEHEPPADPDDVSGSSWWNTTYAEIDYDPRSSYIESLQVEKI